MKRQYTPYAHNIDEGAAKPRERIPCPILLWDSPREAVQERQVKKKEVAVAGFPRTKIRSLNQALL
jgi:hypothetical protein